MNRRNFLQGLLAAGFVTLVQPVTPVSMVAPATIVDFDEIARITLQHYRRLFADSILSARPSYYWLRRNGDFEIIPVERVEKSFSSE